jgi:hypothetical protein
VTIRARVDTRYASLVASTLRGWGISVPRNDVAEAHFTLLAEEGPSRLTARGKWVGHPYAVEDPADIVCSFLAELLKAQANEGGEVLCVHSAAVVFGGKAVVLPATYRSGKSLLSAVLAGRGRRVLADDAIFVDPESGEAVSPGLLPRLRLPLPNGLRAPTLQLEREAMPIRGARYGYVNPAGPVLAANGDRTPIGAFVVPNRQPGADLRLDEADKGTTLKALIWRNFARRGPPSRTLGLLADLVSALPTLILTYGEAEEAADVLEAAFPATFNRATGGPSSEPLAETLLKVGANDGWLAKPDLTERRVGDVLFVADEDTGRIFELNSTAAAIWRLLSGGVDEEAVSSLMCQAFATIDPTRLRTDVSFLAETLRDSNLLVRGA